MAGCAVTKVEAASIQPASGHFRRDDNFVATLSFDDGSLATLTYTALGHKAHPKERMELFFDGVVAELDDYRQSRFSGLSEHKTQSTTQDKGQREELSAFAAAITGKFEWPIPLWQQLQAMQIAFSVEKSIGRKNMKIDELNIDS
jgi:predicted dehydrogenase